MKPFAAIIGAISLIISLTACSSLTPQQKAAKKAEEARRDSIAFTEAAKAIASGDFVLEGNYLSGRTGRRMYVTSSTNFISVRGGQAVLQVSPANGGGPNGVGGISLSGQVTDASIKHLDNGGLQFRANVNGNALSANIILSLIPGTDRASATVMPNFNSLNMTLEGKIVPASQSTIFQGRTF
ncbi:MAG: DUF4251 domain-containing protein [Candidatus Amulumruptor caecigallinarius]|nr:DUF4251 domain-containing protein [Candidatus Amulumruptor caecigallinarius]MCM1397138.1 DUF4251 domain-containing protein [Candidatus Amulumruptor caecigallinarius]MCM1453948.1 DUF4251 domain-containing protein [bacterium]